jgi:hypothetical protein
MGGKKKKKTINHIQKPFTPKNMWNLKLKKFKELSKIWKLQKSFTTCKWGIMYMMF